MMMHRLQRSNKSHVKHTYLGSVAVFGVLAVDLGDVRGDGVGLGHALAARPRVPLRSSFHLHGPGLGGGVVADRHLLV